MSRRKADRYPNAVEMGLKLLELKGHTVDYYYSGRNVYIWKIDDLDFSGYVKNQKNAREWLRWKLSQEFKFRTWERKPYEKD